MFNINELQSLSGVELINCPEKLDVVTVSTDTRKIEPGSLFVAIAGNKFDGHKFVQIALEKGAVACVINKNKVRSLKNVNIPLIAVADSVVALKELSAIYRSKFSTKVIGLTGSAGKTSTKEILTSILSVRYNVASTLANNNNHLGVPLTLLDVKKEHDFVVVELGTNHPGEISYTAEAASPDISLITNIGSSHLEYLKNRNGVLAEKSALFDFTKNDGKVFINVDDNLLANLKDKYSNHITYSMQNDADVQGRIVSINTDATYNIAIKLGAETFVVNSPLYGKHNANNIVGAVAIALFIGLSIPEIQKGVAQLKSAKQRLVAHKHSNFTVLDDTYNANPESMQAAFEVLGNYTAYNNKIAVLGSMFELGDVSPVAHAELATAIEKNGIQPVFLIGKMMSHLQKVLKEKKIKSKYFTSRAKLEEFITEYDFNDSVVLFKGSRGMKMEQFLQKLESKK